MFPHLGHFELCEHEATASLKFIHDSWRPERMKVTLYYEDSVGVRKFSKARFQVLHTSTFVYHC
jgi:hypothetical protein